MSNGGGGGDNDVALRFTSSTAIHIEIYTWDKYSFFFCIRTE